MHVSKLSNSHFNVQKTPRSEGKTGTQRDQKRGGTLVDESGKIRMESPQIHTILASLVNPPETGPTPEQILRQELLKLRSGFSSTEKSAERKHVYNQATGAITNGTETTYILARVLTGSASSQRLTNTIKIRKGTLRFTIVRTASGVGTAVAPMPILTYVIWRDKIPATVGTAPTILGTDANPPASTSLMLSRLGSASLRYNSLAVFNPITAPEYHIYEVKHHELNDDSNFTYTTPATALGIPAPKTWHFRINLDFNGVVQNYAAAASAAPDVNDIYFSFFTDIDYTNLTFTDTIFFTSDVEFEDMQD